MLSLRYKTNREQIIIDGTYHNFNYDKLKNFIDNFISNIIEFNKVFSLVENDENLVYQINFDYLIKNKLNNSYPENDLQRTIKYF